VSPPPRQRLIKLAISRVTFDCASRGGICLNTSCSSNMLGVEEKANGTLVVGAAGGGKRAGRPIDQGVSIPVRKTEDGVLTARQVETAEWRAAGRLVRLAVRIHDALGTTCMDDPVLEGRTLTQEEAAVAQGTSRQRVSQIEHRALGKMRDSGELEAKGEAEWKWRAEGCRRVR
jgi:hypothetical protein